jgi:protein CpxP
MTNRFKISLAAVVAALMLAAVVSTFAEATVDKPALTAQDRQPGRPDGAPHGGPGPGPRMRGPGGPMGGPLGFGPGFQQLDLTDDQKAQLKSIADSHRDEFREAGQKLGAAREAMRALIEADQIDESAIRAKSTEVAAAEAEVAILNARVRQQSMQVLTSEQQAKLKELRESRQQLPMKRRGPGR